VDDRLSPKAEAIVRAVVELLESEGYAAVQLRTVSERAGVSLRTIYKYFPTRDELVLAALERWMEANAYSGIAEAPRQSSLYEALMWSLRHVFEPWERSPRMLEAFHSARMGPGGERLHFQGYAAVEPLAEAFLARVEPAYADDINLVLALAVHAAVSRFVAGDLAATDILPVLERVVFRLTTNNEAVARLPRDRRPTRPRGTTPAAR
jgi:AcrR family transcriptional regulator